MPNMLNNQPPITAPTIPRAMSRKNPSPVLLTSLLPMKPAIRPSTIHAMIDMVCPPGFGQLGVATRSLDPLARALTAEPERLRRLQVARIEGKVGRLGALQDHPCARLSRHSCF